MANARKLLRLESADNSGSAGFWPSGRYSWATAWIDFRASFSPAVGIPRQPARTMAASTRAPAAKTARSSNNVGRVGLSFESIKQFFLSCNFALRYSPDWSGARVRHDNGIGDRSRP